jgi:TatA/E family protein of Tat protein translocase
MDAQPELVLGIFDLSGWHLLIILFVALLIFGRRLPELMKGLGGSIREFKKGMDESPKDSASPYQPPQQQQPPQALPPPPPQIDGAVSRPATELPANPVATPQVYPPPDQHHH